jgi:hypothetical protein
MVNLPPDPNDRQPPGHLRDHDEAIAIAIAFLSVGTILWWGWTRGQNVFRPTVSVPPRLDESLVAEDALSDDETSDLEADRTAPWSSFFRNGQAAPDRDSERLDRVNLDTELERRSLAGPSSTLPGAVTGAAPLQSEAIAPPRGTDDTSETAPSLATGDPEETPNLNQPPPPLDISDVSEDYWAYPYIVDLYEKQLLPDLPSGQLQPDQQLTRAEFAALLNSSFVEDVSGERDLTFSDVPADYWAADAIQQVVDAGYMSGFPDGEFRPEQIMPRYQVLVTLASGLTLAEPASPQAILGQFQGAEEIPGWAQGQVAAAVENKILVNYPNPQALAPQQPATRGEIIVMIHQALLNQGRVDEISSPYVNPQN